MIAAERCALVLLAAGRSSRFGGGKLAADLRGTPLGLHAAVELGDIPFGARVAITGGGDGPDFTACGFDVVVNDDGASGMSRSVRLGVAHARACAAKAVMIVLADMPCVTAAHVRRLLAAAEGPGAVVVSSDGTRASPPALFGADRFDALMVLQGDEGARGLIAAGRRVVTGAAELLDVDTRADLEHLCGLLGAADPAATRPVHGGGPTG